MPTRTLTTRLSSDAWERLAREGLVLWCAVAVLVFAAWQIAAGPARLGAAFFDSDDATRLIEVRELLAGASWYDTALPRVGAPDPLVSHWSRLVDLPIALLVLGFGLVLSPLEAESAARAAWPLVLLGALLWFVARAAEDRAGRRGAVIAIVLATLCFSATTQFAPGRIDHHNVLILCAVAGSLLLASSFTRPQAGAPAGFALGLGVAVGYEALPLAAVALAAAGLAAIVTGRAGAGIRRAALAFAATLLAAFAATTAPDRWLEVDCDALSGNLVLLALCAATGLAAALRVGGPLPLRLAVAGSGGVLGIVLWGAAEPACLAGPFGQVDPALWPLWLDHVSETNDIFWLVSALPALAASFLVHVAAGLAAAILVVRADRDDGAKVYAAILAAATALSLCQVRLMPYAAVLAVPPLAIAIARLEVTASLSAATARLGTLALLNQTTLLVLGALLLGPVGTSGQAFARDVEARRRCLAPQSIAPLASLEPGLIVADVDLGPFIAVATPHRVLSAPYHRLDKAILETHAILFAGPAEAGARLAALGATYVATCEGLPSTKGQRSPPPDALKLALLASRPPDFLEPVPLTGTPIRIWRVKP
jgi:hypothetical protein